MSCRCNAFGPNANCLGHTRFIQIDLALLSGNGLLNVNFRINSTRAAQTVTLCLGEEGWGWGGSGGGASVCRMTEEGETELLLGTFKNTLECDFQHTLLCSNFLDNFFFLSFFRLC